MSQVEVSAGVHVEDRGYGGAYEVDPEDMAPQPHEAARQYFTRTGVLVSPTADGQSWQVPGTGVRISAESARTISQQVRRTLGRATL